MMPGKNVKKTTEGGNWPFYQFDPVLGFWGKPGVERDVFFQQRNAHVRCSLNDEGLRDKPFTAKGKEKSILCIGGSHTWGAGVEQDSRYTEHLADRTGKTVVNLGHCSFGLNQVCLAIMERARRYSPSIIVIEQYPWAIHRVFQTYVLGYVIPYFFLDADNNLRLQKISKSARIGLVRKIIGSFLNYRKSLQEFRAGIDLENKYDPLTDPIFLYWKVYYYDHMYAIVDKLLEVIKGVCRQNDFKLAFALGAIAQQFGPESPSSLIDYDLPRKRLKALLEKNKIEFADMSGPMLQAHTAEAPVIFPDGHINRKGHEVFAATLHEKLERLGWLTP